jgi:hypothetical protein
MIRTLLILLLASIATASFAQEPPQTESPTVIIKTQKKRGDALNDSIYQIRVLESELDGMYIPKDLYDVFEELDKLMDDEAKKTFMAYSDAEVDRKTHGSLGVWLEHKWSLSEGSRLSDYFRKMKVPHYDYMIGIIITSYHRHLHEKDLKIKEQVNFFRNTWNKKQEAKAKELIQRGEVKE